MLNLPTTTTARFRRIAAILPFYLTALLVSGADSAKASTGPEWVAAPRVGPPPALSPPPAPPAAPAPPPAHPIRSLLNHPPGRDGHASAGASAGDRPRSRERAASRATTGRCATGHRCSAGWSRADFPRRFRPGTVPDTWSECHPRTELALASPSVRSDLWTCMLHRSTMPARE